MSNPELAARRTSAAAVLADYMRVVLHPDTPLRDDPGAAALWAGRLGTELRSLLGPIPGSCVMCGHHGQAPELDLALVCHDEDACIDRLAADWVKGAKVWLCDACGALSDKPGCMAPGCPGPIDGSVPLVPFNGMASHRQEGPPC